MNIRGKHLNKSIYKEHVAIRKIHKSHHRHPKYEDKEELKK